MTWNSYFILITSILTIYVLCRNGNYRKKFPFGFICVRTLCPKEIPSSINNADISYHFWRRLLGFNNDLQKCLGGYFIPPNKGRWVERSKYRIMYLPVLYSRLLHCIGYFNSSLNVYSQLHHKSKKPRGPNSTKNKPKGGD